MDGKDTRGLKTFQVNRLGIARTFQNIRLFSNMSVMDNVLVGLHHEMDYGFAKALLRLPGFYKSERIARNRALEYLSIFNMQDMAGHKAAACPTALSAGWRSSAPWPRTPPSCCWMSRPRA